LPDASGIELTATRAVATRRAATQRQMARVACIMMQKNEGALLDLWLRYHAYVFGPRNLFVFDNGSTDRGVRERLERAEAEGVTVLWDHDQREDFERKGKLFQKLMRELEGDGFDFFMPLDCDEFVAHQDLDGRISCEPEVVTGYLRARHHSDPRVLLIRGSYFNIPERPGVYYFAGERKCFFARGAVKALGMGFHQATSRHSTTEVRTSIVHFHYRYKPYAMFGEHARQKLAARAAEFDAERIKAYRGKGSHLVRFMAMGGEAYQRYFRRFDAVRISSFRKALVNLGADLPY
jgi:hypothetical protein